MVQVHRASADRRRYFKPTLTVTHSEMAFRVVKSLFGIFDDPPEDADDDWFDEDLNDPAWHYRVLVVCNSVTELRLVNDAIDAVLEEVDVEELDEGRVRYWLRGKPSGYVEPWNRVEPRVEHRLVVVEKHEFEPGYDAKNRRAPEPTTIHDVLNLFSGTDHATKARRVVTDDDGVEREFFSFDKSRAAEIAPLIFLASTYNVLGADFKSYSTIYGFVPAKDESKVELKAEASPAKLSAATPKAPTALDRLLELYPVGSPPFMPDDAAKAVIADQIRAGEKPSQAAFIKKLFKSGNSALEHFENPAPYKPYTRKPPTPTNTPSNSNNNNKEQS
ncbi:MAG: hypothetical protein ACKV2O_15445 [Acidimicrobiales bacterium]